METAWEQRGATAAGYASCMLGFFGLFLTRWLTNQYVFPLYTAAFAAQALPAHALKDIAVGSSVLVLAAVAVGATWRQRWFANARLPYLSVACLVTGIAATVAAQYGAPFPLYVLAAVLVEVGCSLACVMVCVGAMELGVQGAGVCIAVATGGTYAMRAALASLDAQAGYLVFVLAAVVTLGVSVAPSARVLESLASRDDPAELAVTHPTSFLPFGHRLYVSLFAFEVAYGLAITVAVFTESATWSPGVLVLLAAALLVLLVPHAGAKADWLLILCILCVLAGILSFSVPDPWAGAMRADSLSAGSNLFQALAFFTLASLGARNRLGGLPTVAWGCAVMNLGVILGAGAGHVTERWFTDAATASTAAVVTALVYTAAMLVIMHGFSIQGTIRSIESVRTPEPSRPARPNADDVCARLANRHGLTPREAQVLVLLARGRNSPFIQEELGISYNTARTHVRHIYEKCGFHTQQELIDAVEGWHEWQADGADNARGARDLR